MIAGSLSAQSRMIAPALLTDPPECADGFRESMERSWLRGRWAGLAARQPAQPEAAVGAQGVQRLDGDEPAPVLFRGRRPGQPVEHPAPIGRWDRAR